MSRKVRSDKKIQLAPSVPIHMKESLYQLAYLLDCPVKTLCENILIECADDPQLMQVIGKYCKRDIKIGDVLFIGHPQCDSIHRVEGETSRISMRMHQTFTDSLKGLSYAIGCSASRTALLMLETSLEDKEFMNYVCSRFTGYETNRKEVERLIEGHKTVVEKVMDFVINRWDR